MKNSRGFTLIEMLVVVGILGVLAHLALTSLYVYRSKAAYSTLQITMKNTRNAAEASLIDPEHQPPAVALVSQNVPGPLSDPAAAAFLPGMQIPKNIKFQVSYDPACDDGGCVASFVEIKHCSGKEYMQWLRFGDGMDMPLEPIAGDGCQ